jgi:antibiotic biosynthesis monooxygenase (ABM) superfamily enzyme
LEILVEHEGKALAADEFDVHHHKGVGMASVHVRAVVTWLAIFPLAATGMCALGAWVPQWHPVLRAFVLTLVVVPTAVYFAVPRLLLLQAQIGRATRTRAQRRAKRNWRVRDRRGA